MTKTTAAAARRTQQLGMPYGTACGRLRKLILFDVLRRHGENVCYRCNEPILCVEELTIEHKVRWENSDAELFWDLSNIAFSHPPCNRRAVGRPIIHGTTTGYRYGCRCRECQDAHTSAAAELSRRQRPTGMTALG